MSKEETFQFIVRPDGTCDPPEWSVRLEDGSPLTLEECKGGRVTVILYRNGEKFGEGFIEPNPALGDTKHYPWTAARAAYELDGE